MKKKDEEHIIIRAVKDYWQIIVSVTAVVTTLSLLGLRVANLESKVEAKADKTMIEEQLKALNEKIDTGFFHTSNSIDNLTDLLYTHMGIK